MPDNSIESIGEKIVLLPSAQVNSIARVLALQTYSSIAARAEFATRWRAAVLPIFQLKKSLLTYIVLQNEKPSIRLFVSVAALYAGKLRELESRKTHSTVDP